MQAYTALGLRLLLYLLEEFPAQLGSLTPTALVPALGQILSYSSSELQVRWTCQAGIGVGAVGMEGTQVHQMTDVCDICQAACGAYQLR